jgi:hypothetical protein
MTYTLTSTTTIIRDADNAFIPADPANTDYQAYQAWLAEGNTPNPYVPPTPPAQSQPTLAELQAQLNALTVQITALSSNTTPAS